MTDPHANNPHQTPGVHMPRPTAWPVVVALGITLVALGFATSLVFSVVGGVLLLASICGWIANLLPGRGHEHEPLVPADERPKPVVARPGTVQPLKPGVVGFRFQLPEKVHPISAGLKGGIVGGLIMPLPAFAWAIFNGHSIWLPVNLLAGLVVPGMEEVTMDKLQEFNLLYLIGGSLMHVLLSIGLGLMYAVILPTLPPFPGGPLVFGGIVLPLFWTAVSYGLMGIVNPVLRDYVEWRYYIDSQVFYGVAASLVIMRSEKIPIAPRGPGGDSGPPSPPPGWAGCLLVCCLLAVGCSDNLPGKPQLKNEFVMPSQVTDFATLYAQRCAACHGAEGNLGAGPPLKDPLFVSLVSDEELQQVIARGRTGTLMPAWASEYGGPLTSEQVIALADGIKEQWPPPADWKLPAGSPSLTASATGNAEAGLQSFSSACAGCHGTDGHGSELAGAIRDADALSLMSDTLLRRYIITGRADLGMPNFADNTGRANDFPPLTSADIDNLVALLASWRKEN